MTTLFKDTVATNEAPIESYTDETLALWRQYPELKGRSRQRPSPEKLTFINEVLRGVYVGDATSCNKSHVRSRYKICNDMLQYIPEDGRPPRTVITDDEAYSLIVESHIKYGHAGREKVFHYLKDKFYHITREEVGWVLKQCKKCRARCRPENAGEHLPKSVVSHGIGTEVTRRPVSLPDTSDEVLLGQYSKKFQALERESRLDETQWIELCLGVAKDVRGPMGLDLMLESEDKGKAWDDHFTPRCEEYTERYWGTKVEGRWWAGDNLDYPDRVLIKDFLRRLFMNFFQKERVHRARIARKVAKTAKGDSSSSATTADASPQQTSWMRSHPPIRIPLKPTDSSNPSSPASTPCPTRTSLGKHPRENTSTHLNSPPPSQGSGEPFTKTPRLDRLRVILTSTPSQVAPPEEPQAQASTDPSSGILFMTRVQSDAGEGGNEVRLVHGSTLTSLPFREVLRKLRRKHRLGEKQTITEVVLDFRGRKLCIDAEDEDGQRDWETWVEWEGALVERGRQVEVVVKVVEVVV